MVGLSTMCKEILLGLFDCTLFFLLRISVSSLVDSWPSLLALLKDSVQLGLPAPGQFLILGCVLLLVSALL